MNIIYPPNNLIIPINHTTIFLAGSIEMNNAINWQNDFISEFEDYQNLTIFNPRRKDWDSTWKQTSDDPNFNDQVNWELDHLELADHILMFFDPKTKSPISLLELGLFADSGKMIVVCPDGFYRKGNIEITCKRFKNISLLNTIQEAKDMFHYILK